MQVSVFSVLDGLTIDIPAITSAAEKGWAVARPALVKGAAHGADLAVDATAHLVHVSRLVIEAGRQHRAKYGAQYAAVLLTVLGLLAMLVRAQLGREGAYEELREAVVATREAVKVWVWTQLVKGYEVCLEFSGWGEFAEEVKGWVLGQVPEWVWSAMLAGE
jgi:hypothetical protein